jgi:hypothetical protein
LVVGFAFIAPFTRFSFGYWFNHGQPPHTARVSLPDIVDEFLGASQWIKGYLFFILILVLAAYKKASDWLKDRNAVLFLLLTLGILAEAAILQVTSYTPPDNNIFFHSFALAYILSSLVRLLSIDLSKWRPLLAAGFALLLWWSSVFWKYFQRIVQKNIPTAQTSPSGENVVNRHTYQLSKGSGEIPMTDWTYSSLYSLKKIYMPRQTVDGINRLLAHPEWKGHPELRVLNMTELPSLAVEMPYKPETGPDIPLWYHLGVGMFNQQAREYEQKIAALHYDLAIFEYIPSLNNFFPFRVRDSLFAHYQLIDSFPAPRRGETQGIIEVFRKP